VGLALALLVCLVPGGGRLATAEHTAALQWMYGTLGVHHAPCCGARDCHPATVRRLRTGARTVQVQITTAAGTREVALPPEAVHPSQTPQGYWCGGSDGRPPSARNTRCVFVATPEDLS